MPLLIKIADIIFVLSVVILLGNSIGYLMIAIKDSDYVTMNIFTACVASFILVLKSYSDGKT